MTSGDIIKKLTAQTIIGEMGVSVSSVKEAKRAGKFPANWYAPLLPLCRAQGFEPPLGAFNFRSNEDAA
jgi:hypothetical protein